MNGVESTSEQPIQTPTEASKGFLDGWGKSVLNGLFVVNVGLQAVAAGTAAAQGESDRAILLGISAGLFGFASVGQGIAMNAEVRSLKNKLSHRK